MQCTQTLRLHALSTRKSWVIHINLMRGKKNSEYSKCQIYSKTAAIAFYFLWLKSI